MTNLSIEFKKFPTTRYQGSKRKILYWIYECIKELDFNKVIDAFGGSASFSYLAKKMGKQVIYNDLMRFNHLIGKSIIENNDVIVDEKDINFILSNRSSDKSYKVIQTNFNNIYFLDSENEWLDNIIYNINHLVGLSHEIEFKQAILFNALFQSSLAKRPFNLFHRKNLNIRTSDVKRNFGNKTTWEKSFENHMLNFIIQINGAVFNNGMPCLALNKSVYDIDCHDADCVYLDPPYYNTVGSNETSNYYKCYHFLEGIANYKDWESRINSHSLNKSFKLQETAAHFNKQQIEQSFEQIFLKFLNKTIILSYKSGGQPSIEWFETSLKKMGKTVKTSSINYSYALNKNGTKGIPTVEALIVAK